jgi:hypothetical protein
MDFHVNGGIGAQAEVQAGIVAGIEATLTHNALGLRFPTVMDENTGSNGASVGLNPLKLNLDPIGISAYIVAQQGRRFVQVYDQDIDVTVVIEVSKRTSPAAMGRGHAGAGRVDEFFKGLIAKITKNDAWSLVSILAKLSFDFRVNVTGNHEEIRMTIVVEVHHPGTPTDKTGLYSNMGAAGNIIEIAFAIIVVKNAGVVGKVGLE